MAGQNDPSPGHIDNGPATNSTQTAGHDGGLQHGYVSYRDKLEQLCAHRFPRTVVHGSLVHNYAANLFQRFDYENLVERYLPGSLESGLSFATFFKEPEPPPCSCTEPREQPRKHIMNVTAVDISEYLKDETNEVNAWLRSNGRGQGKPMPPSPWAGFIAEVEALHSRWPSSRILNCIDDAAARARGTFIKYDEMHKLGRDLVRQTLMRDSLTFHDRIPDNLNIWNSRVEKLRVAIEVKTIPMYFEDIHRGTAARLKLATPTPWLEHELRKAESEAQLRTASVPREGGACEAGFDNKRETQSIVAHMRNGSRRFKAPSSSIGDEIDLPPLVFVPGLYPKKQTSNSGSKTSFPPLVSPTPKLPPIVKPRLVIPPFVMPPLVQSPLNPLVQDSSMESKDADNKSLDPISTESGQETEAKDDDGAPSLYYSCETCLEESPQRGGDDSPGEEHAGHVADTTSSNSPLSGQGAETESVSGDPAEEGYNGGDELGVPSAGISLSATLKRYLEADSAEGTLRARTAGGELTPMDEIPSFSLPSSIIDLDQISIGGGEPAASVAGSTTSAIAGGGYVHIEHDSDRDYDTFNHASDDDDDSDPWWSGTIPDYLRRLGYGTTIAPSRDARF